MPIYEFKCASCNQPFERVLSMRMSSSNAQCPHCSSWVTQRIYTTAPNFIIRPDGYNLHPGDPGYDTLDPNHKPAQPRGR